MISPGLRWLPRPPASAPASIRRPHFRLARASLAHAASALLLFATLCFALAVNAQHAPARQIDFVYFGSPECPYCRNWEAHDLPQLEKSALFRQIRYTKVTKSLGSPVPPAASFPDDIRQLRDAIAEKIVGAGSPMYAIVVDGEVVAGWRGSKKYSPSQILEIIREQQAQAASASAPRPTQHLIANR